MSPVERREWCNVHYRRLLKAGAIEKRTVVRSGYVPGATEKACSACRVVKPLNEFHRLIRARDGRQGYCKECAAAAIAYWRRRNPEMARAADRRANEKRGASVREYMLLTTYGITLADYDHLLDMQGGVCAICAGPPQQAGNYHVDHDHDSGFVRGLLCMSCNRGIGYLRDDPALIQRALEYLNDANSRSGARA